MIKVEIMQVLKPKEKVIVEFEFKCKTRKGSKTSKGWKSTSVEVDEIFENS